MKTVSLIRCYNSYAFDDIHRSKHNINIEIMSMSAAYNTTLNTKGASRRILRGGGGCWSFFEINILVGKMGEINTWLQGMVEIQLILR